MIPPDIAAVADYEPHARRRMGENAWAYVAGGAADELTLAENRAAFARLRLKQRVLTDMAGAGTRLSLFGQDYAHPVLVAPSAFHRLLHPEGELATATGASALQAGMVVSAQASLPLEAIVARASPPPWFQLYIQPDRAFTQALVRRAEAAGCTALVVTVDAPISLRNREQRAGFRLPAGVEAVNLRGAVPPPPAPPGEASEVFGSVQRGAPLWADIEALRRQTRLPLLLKGIMTPEDALRGLEAGADGLVVSNHGGRVLDGQPATIEVLEEVAEAVAGRVPLLLDGGIRRGTDVLKALALGASAVMVGRPVLHGLAVGGATGVAHVLKLLRTELEVAMVQTGCPSLSAITPDILWRPRGGR
ncbi:alpha-hydroxy acid oxidase [Roseomonas marmotae]|uniref:Alpha-hydroxy-acid oxidizing protein n=1 Tax=Roseomonas marmotae TaxID=2768161 RepID=A0ABS3KGU1_9PROT|nr:alpha-hydroxy acid oxidase [Roseomonas marmotae]MBO1075828.1 alpha-hydroxy-acid oxidizing protein [Roseomonas marmotae]QTI81978.1 alpha-hydroxy-acid oxidizing protein [Roseomonas marmotae]